jgi:DNA-directed RNA polymerase sigma subunit (sigma70/sigma32)
MPKKTAYEIRPDGWLGKLYDLVRPKAKKNPAVIVQKAAEEAVRQNIISSTRYAILQHRFPFPGFERKTLRATGELLGVSHETVHAGEFQAYMKLKEFLGLNKI